MTIYVSYKGNLSRSLKNLIVSDSNDNCEKDVTLSEENIYNACDQNVDPSVTFKTSTEIILTPGGLRETLIF